MDGRGTKCHRNIAENYNRLSMVTSVTDDRRQTDGRATAYSEREREFTFVKKYFLKITTFLFQRLSIALQRVNAVPFKTRHLGFLKRRIFNGG